MNMLYAEVIFKNINLKYWLIVIIITEIDSHENAGKSLCYNKITNLAGGLSKIVNDDEI